MNETSRASRSSVDTVRFTIVFLLVTVLVYGAVYCAAVSISRFAACLSVFAFSAVLAAFITLAGRAAFYRLSLPEIDTPFKALRILPLLIVPVFLLAEFGFPVPDAGWFLLAGAALTEEIIFRGFFPRLFPNMPRLAVTVLSAAVFALFHFVNLLSKPFSPAPWIQIFCAFCAGVLFSAVTFDLNSLLPSFFAHFFINCVTPETKTDFSIPEMLSWVAVLLFGLLFAARPAVYHKKGL